MTDYHQKYKVPVTKVVLYCLSNKDFKLGLDQCKNGAGWAVNGFEQGKWFSDKLRLFEGHTYRLSQTAKGTTNNKTELRS